MLLVTQYSSWHLKIHFWRGSIKILKFKIQKEYFEGLKKCEKNFDTSLQNIKIKYLILGWQNLIDLRGLKFCNVQYFRQLLRYLFTNHTTHKREGSMKGPVGPYNNYWEKNSKSWVRWNNKQNSRPQPPDFAAAFRPLTSWPPPDPVAADSRPRRLLRRRRWHRPHARRGHRRRRLLFQTGGRIHRLCMPPPPNPLSLPVL
jgi:hypothetical protein